MFQAALYLWWDWPCTCWATDLPWFLHEGWQITLSVLKIFRRHFSWFSLTSLTVQQLCCVICHCNNLDSFSVLRNRWMERQHRIVFVIASCKNQNCKISGGGSVPLLHRPRQPPTPSSSASFTCSPPAHQVRWWCWRCWWSDIPTNLYPAMLLTYVVPSCVTCFLRQLAIYCLTCRYVMESVCEAMFITDVTIVTATDTLRAHRSILSAHSPFLAFLLGEQASIHITCISKIAIYISIWTHSWWIRSPLKRSLSSSSQTTHPSLSGKKFSSNTERIFSLKNQTLKKSDIEKV